MNRLTVLIYHAVDNGDSVIFVDPILFQWQMGALLLQRIDAYKLRHPKMYLDGCKGGLVSYLRFHQHLCDIKQRFTKA
jgi:hypothetical protein